MDVLVDHWATSIGDDEVKTWSLVGPSVDRSVSVPLLFLLVERADHVSAAARIARVVGGFVDIGE